MKLRRQRLVMRDNKRRLLHLLDYLGHRIRLTGSGNAKKSLESISRLYALCYFLYRLRLISCHLKF